MTSNFTDTNGNTSLFYLIRYFDPIHNIQSEIVTSFFEFTPREARLVTQLRTFVPAIMLESASPNDLRNSIILAIHTFNIYPPSTPFDINSFPKEYESLLLMMSQVTFLYYKYLGIAIRDFSYNDNGLSLNIDRGSKIKQLTDDLMAQYNGLIQLVKLDFATTGVGLGTLQLPISIGGNLNKGLLNILDAFTSIGR